MIVATLYPLVLPVFTTALKPALSRWYDDANESDGRAWSYRVRDSA